jgi:hypothetical protein
MLVLGVLRQWPLAALLPAALFFVLAFRTRRSLVWGAAFIWATYAVYEYLMSLGVLCPDECSRVDLLVIDPFLVVLSVVALFSSLRGRKEIDLS